MTLRVWHQGFVELDGLPAYADALSRHAAAVAPALTVDLHGLAAGTYTPHRTAADIARDPALLPLGIAQLVANARRAELEGYDVLALMTVQNIGLAQVRAAVAIPVASYGEAAMTAACALGERFGVVAFDRAIAAIVDHEIARLGLASRALPVELVDADYGGVVEAFARPARLVAAFTVAASRLAARGARSVVPGQAIMAEVLWQAGVRDVGGVLVIDAIGVTLAEAERLARQRG